MDRSLGNAPELDESDHLGGETEPPFVQSMCASIRSGRPGDAVRLFLRSMREGMLPGIADAREESRTILGEALLQRLIVACAEFPCPYCCDGSAPCVGCAGLGRTEGTMACLACGTFGVLACDFCGGSGLAAYSFFPAGFEEAIAGARVDNAAQQVERPEPARRTSSASGVRRFLELRRVHAVFTNALDLLRSGSIAAVDHAEAARLAARCWIGLARTEQSMSRVLGELIQLGSTATAASEDERRFREDRANLLADKRAQLMARAQSRVRHVRERKSRGTS